jgi:hypothetical protein
MAKVSFNKLGLKINNNINTFTFNEQEIEVKEYLSTNEKLSLISDIINNCAEDQKFYNPGKLEIFSVITIIEYYTNIKFTDKQKEDVVKLYDLFISSNLKTTIFELIPQSELNFISTTITETIKSIYSYNNSIYGILDNVVNDYDGMNFDINHLWEQLANKENLGFLQEVIQKMG